MPLETTIRLASAADTQSFAFKLGELLREAVLIALIGPLGAGKTTFSQGLARGIEVDEIVNSPTFTLINEYHSGRIPFYHLDFYRLEEEKEKEYFLRELEEILSRQSVVLIEWADLIDQYLLQKDRLQIEFVIPSVQESGDGLSEPNQRQLRIQAFGKYPEDILSEIRKIYF